MSKMPFFIIAGLTVALAAGGTAWWLARPTDARFAHCSASSVAGATIGGPFSLVDETGATVTDVEVLTKPSLVYFGYTFCPDVCPTDSARNAEALDLLQQRGYDAQAVFITIDPARDTVERVREFTDYFHDDMIGLTGSADQVAVASRAYKTYSAKQETGDEYYLMDHSTFTYLVLPDAGFVQFFRRENTPQEIADTMACFIDAS
ncbi:MAG: SCO family protein [Rhodobacterales bacterium]|nr:SCO family protein [Rhodobacterales bacterium]NCO85058.1 SCO family protein [Rhodobacterales bacterium]